MNAEILKKMAGWAEEVALKMEITNDRLILSTDGQHSQPPVAVIPLPQPQHDLLFNFLCEIGDFELHFRHPRPLPFPPCINRPYENEILGDATYKTRRLLRLKLSRKWQAALWALCAYRKIGYPDDLKAFLKQHPEKLPLYRLASAGDVLSRITASKRPRHAPTLP